MTQEEVDRIRQGFARAEPAIREVERAMVAFRDAVAGADRAVRECAPQLKPEGS